MVLQKRTRARIGELLAYASIGVAVALGAVLYGAYAATHGGDPHLPVGWIGMVLVTAMVFGYVIRSQRALLIRPRLWGILALCLLVHGAIWVTAITAIGNRALPFIGIAAMPECLAITRTLEGFSGK